MGFGVFFFFSEALFPKEGRFMAGCWCPHRFVLVCERKVKSEHWLIVDSKLKHPRVTDSVIQSIMLTGLVAFFKIQCPMSFSRWLAGWPEKPYGSFWLPFENASADQLHPGENNAKIIEVEVPLQRRWLGFFRHLQRRSRCNSRTLLRWTLDLPDFPSMLISSWGSGISRSMSGWWKMEASIGNHQLGVSKNSGTPKWMVYNGKPY